MDAVGSSGPGLAEDLWVCGRGGDSVTTEEFPTRGPPFLSSINESWTMVVIRNPSVLNLGGRELFPRS